MIIKILSTLILFCIGLIEKFYNEKINKYNILKHSLFILLLLSFIIGSIAIIYDDIENKSNLNDAKVARDNLFQENIELNDKLNNFRNEFQDFNTDSKKQNIILQNKVSELNTKLDPFVKLAISKYPTSNINDSLKKLKDELEETKKLAAPNSLSFYEKKINKIDEGFSIVLKFKPSKNEPLGILVFVAEITNSENAKIIDFWPLGSFNSGKDSKKIYESGKKAKLIYSLFSAGYPKIELKVSDTAQILIKGNHELEPFILNIK